VTSPVLVLRLNAGVKQLYTKRLIVGWVC